MSKKCQKVFAVGRTSCLNKKLHRGDQSYSVDHELLFAWVDEWKATGGHMAWMPYGVSGRRGLSIINDPHSSAALWSSTSCFKCCWFWSRRMNGNTKLQRMPFVFAIFIQKHPKWTGMQQQFVSIGTCEE